MKRFLLNLLDSTNAYVETHLFLICLGALTLIGLSIFHVVVLRQSFDQSQFGEGLGFLLAGGGAAAFGQGLQRSNERKKK